MADSNEPSERAILTPEERAMIANIGGATQLPLPTVARLVQIDLAILSKLVRDGVIDGIADKTRYDIGTCDVRRAREVAEKLHAARKQVEGQGIRALEAEKKYGFVNQSIYTWYRNGWIRVAALAEDGSRLFNEGDIAFARALADLGEHIRGKPVFPAKPRSGRPRKTQTES